MISFIILHYKNINDTLECLKSIKLQKTKHKVSIIVVDNHTLNKEDLSRVNEYTKDVILLDKNYGFAKANNIGCKYAIEKYQPEFLGVINNDTLINQKNFIDKIYNIYEKTKFDILGPKIITNNGDSVNPFPVYDNLEIIDEKIKYSEKLIKIYQNVFLRYLLYIYLWLKFKIKKKPKNKNGYKSQYNVALHGCALIFSRKYYKKYDNVFYNETFLYHEEEFLNYRKNKDNLISYYASDLEIIHKEGASLNLLFSQKDYAKQIYKNKEIIKSLKLLKKVMKEGIKI